MPFLAEFEPRPLNLDAPLDRGQVERLCRGALNTADRMQRNMKRTSP